MKSGWTDDATPVSGARNTTDHYLELDQNEVDMLNHIASQSFGTIILLVNSGTSMELGFLEDADAYDDLGLNAEVTDKIESCLQISNMGAQGMPAIADIISGDVNPSGSLTAIYSKDFKLDPTWQNFGNNLVSDGDKYYQGAWGASAASSGAYFVSYEEGIYVGYRYYETRAYEESIYDVDGSGDGTNGNWYEENVVYPFGYGLSYTDFEWTVGEVSDTTLTKDGTISVDVTVKNVGSVAGKDTVQLYYTAPVDYDNFDDYGAMLEKSQVVLGAFDKTDLLEAGESQTLTLTMPVSDMASYDWNDANRNNITGYELEKGNYVITIGENSHAWAEDDALQITYKLDSDVYYAEDTTTGNTVENRFDEMSNHLVDYDNGYMSRGDFYGTFPTSPVAETRSQSYNVWEVSTDTTAFFSDFGNHSITDFESYDEGQKWYSDTMPTQGQNGNMTIYDMFGLDYNDESWESLLNQLTIDEMATLVGVGAFSTAYTASISKPETLEFDGPGGFVIGSFMSATGSGVEVCFFPCETLIAQTWNLDLCYEMGNAIGEESLWGVDGTTISGWYAPAVNLHRSQFGGRNFEYYSEDGFLSGKLAASVIQGAMEKGTYTFVKHFAVNDQETNRSANGLATWLSEQALREIYLKPFEIAVKEGGTTAMMSSFNRLGTEWAGGSYDLLTEVLRNEWGFEGMVITDYNNGSGSYMDLDKMMRAGGDLNLFQSGWVSTSSDALTATQVTVMRQACKNILYTVANSNAMNNAVGKQLSPTWVIVMFVIMGGVTVGIATWGFFTIKKARKKKATENN